MTSTRLMVGLSVALACSQVGAQTFSGNMVTIFGGTATLGMDPADFAAPPPFDAPFHEASLSAFQMWSSPRSVEC